MVTSRPLRSRKVKPLRGFWPHARREYCYLRLISARLRHGSRIIAAKANPRLILTLKCPDAIGIVAAVSSFLAERGWRKVLCHYLPVTPETKAAAEKRYLEILEEKGAELLVAHHHRPKDFVEIGRDLECQVLARAVRWHLERWVMVTGNKTVVFA